MKLKALLSMIMAFVSRSCFCLKHLSKTVLSCQIARGFSKTGYLNGAHSKYQVPAAQHFAVQQKKMELKGTEHRIKRSQLPNWNYKTELKTFSVRLNEDFDLNYLREAFTDSSYVQQEKLEREKVGLPDDDPLALSSNENFCDIGESLIVNYSQHFLSNAFPLLPKEGVEALVNYLSSEEVCAELGKNLGMKDLILSAHYELTTEIFSKSFKAVIGALNVSSGNERTHLFIRDIVITHLIGKEIIDVWQIEKPIDTLQDILSRNGFNKAEPRLIFEGSQGTITAVYEVGVYLDQEIIGSGFGETVSIAVEHAALNSLQRMFKIGFQSTPMLLNKVPSGNPTNSSINEWTPKVPPNLHTF